MNAKDAIRSSFNLSDSVLKAYVGDLSDAELLLRPGDGCNHIAWQLGHLISSEIQLLQGVSSQAPTELPAGFVENHSKENAGSDDATKFLKRDEYLELYSNVRAASLAALDDATDAELDADGPEHMRAYCPTNGDMYGLIANHPMMHAGQFVIVRRKTGKPIVM